MKKKYILINFIVLLWILLSCNNKAVLSNSDNGISSHLDTIKAPTLSHKLLLTRRYASKYLSKYELMQSMLDREANGIYFLVDDFAKREYDSRLLYYSFSDSKERLIYRCNNCNFHFDPVGRTVNILKNGSLKTVGKRRRVQRLLCNRTFRKSTKCRSDTHVSGHDLWAS